MIHFTRTEWGYLDAAKMSSSKHVLPLVRCQVKITSDVREWVFLEWYKVQSTYMRDTLSRDNGK